MCIALKVPTVIEIAKKAISENKSVVIGLQSTGEARTKASVGDQTTVSEFISAPQGILKELVKKAFPLPPIPESILEERRKAALEEKEKNRDRTRKSRHIQNDLYINISIVVILLILQKKKVVKMKVKMKIIILMRNQLMMVGYLMMN